MSKCDCGRTDIPLGMTGMTAGGITHGVTACVSGWAEQDRAEQSDALRRTRDALHTAFGIIANARNSLDNGERDPVLADQWHEAAARFMQDYNANLDVYTGYRVSGRTAIQTVGDAPGCPACDGVAGTECRCHLRTGCDLGTTRCHRAEAAEAVIERVRELRNRIIAEWPTDTVNIGVVIGLLDDALDAPLTDNDALNQTRDDRR